MKRISNIKGEFCATIINCEISDFEKLLYEMQNISFFKDLVSKYLSEFDDKYFSDESDEEMSYIIRNGVYRKKLIKWLNENIE